MQQACMFAANTMVLLCDMRSGNGIVDPNVHDGRVRHRITSGCRLVLASGTAVCADLGSVPDRCLPHHADADAYELEHRQYSHNPLVSILLILPPSFAPASA